MTNGLWYRRTGSPVPVAAPGVEQTAVARAGGTVVQAGRDVISGNVFVGRFARLRDVWLDPASVFDEVDVDRFVGRTWLAESVDAFVDRHDRGYVVVQAAAGPLWARLRSRPGWLVLGVCRVISRGGVRAVWPRSRCGILRRS